jgi:DNA mismatch repair protein MutS
LSSDFHSILFDSPEAGSVGDCQKVPEFFTDLNLDQVVASITAGREEYNLRPFFYVNLRHVETVNYRYDILRDMENPSLFEQVGSFAQKMRIMRDCLAQGVKLRYKYPKEGWFLQAAHVYCDAVLCLTRDLARANLRSRGLTSFCQYLASYTESVPFASLVADTRKVKTDLAGIRYCLHINGNRITISRYDSESDYGAEVLQTFEKFKQGAAKEYRFEIRSGPDMNHVEAAVLDLVAQLYPNIFLSLDQYENDHRGYLDDTIKAFDREIQFYVACLEYIERFKTAKLPFCYPVVTNRSKEVKGCDVFDIALANRLVDENAPVVTNNFYLKDPERIVVVSGPNQGGKTTFARTFGQLHYLASVGFLVPGSKAVLFLYDNLFTHFEREEDLENQSSKLEDDLLRIHRILEQATPESILIMNESFVSTTLNDALFLSQKVMQQIIQRDMLCVSVTFLDELASLSETTVSMVSTLDPHDPARRTFKVVRKPADGRAHAVAIAQKYRLTYESVKERIAQ